MKLIDLRSDTVTRPTLAMHEAMFNAAVGDDVFDEDPTVKKLERKAADLFGKEAALFCPSGTMTNQIGIRVQTQPQQEIICEKTSHIYYYEAGGIASNSGLSMRLLDGDKGRITAQQVLDNINPDNIHQPPTSLVSIENTSNKGGGSYYQLSVLKEISKAAKDNALKTHLDGARIFNAIAETNYTTQDIGPIFDTISICLSKGLGAPVGSLLLSTSDNIKKAKRIRKAMGGGMRQSGYLAAAGIYALDHHVTRLKEDHIRAKKIESELKTLSYVEEIMPVDTNIVVYRIKETINLPSYLEYLSSNNVKALQFGKQTIRMVTHLDFEENMLNDLITVLKKY